MKRAMVLMAVWVMGCGIDDEAPREVPADEVAQALPGEQMLSRTEVIEERNATRRERLALNPTTGRMLRVIDPRGAEQGRQIVAADRVLIRGDTSALEAELGAIGGVQVRWLGTADWHVATIPGRTLEQLDASLARIASSPAVRQVELDGFAFPSKTPSDPEINSEGLWGMHAIGMPDAWSQVTDSRSVRVCIIDTGVDVDHPDLKGNLWTNDGETGQDSQGRNKRTNGIDDDGNGYIDDVHGWDFYQQNGNVDEQAGDMHSVEHGTHVAGIIGARGNNGIGVVGVSWRSEMVILKTSLAFSEIIEAMEYARSVGCRVINNSYGTSVVQLETGNAIEILAGTDALASGVADLRTGGILHVCAAGNSSLDIDMIPVHPAAYGHWNVVSVAATGIAFERESGAHLGWYTNIGKRKVDLGAPGDDVLSTVPGGGYAILSGTSMAAPHVTGALALVTAAYPGLSPEEVKQAVLQSVDALPTLRHTVSSGGRLNVANALALAGGAKTPTEATNTQGTNRIVTLNADPINHETDYVALWPGVPVGDTYDENESVFFADMQTARGGDTAWAGSQIVRSTANGGERGMWLWIDEEQSRDQETNHNAGGHGGEHVGAVSFRDGMLRNTAGDLIGEVYQILPSTAIGYEWTRFSLPGAQYNDHSYADPIVIAREALTSMIVRLRELGPGSFEFSYHRWTYDETDYQNPPKVTVGLTRLDYLVVEQGVHDLMAGPCLQAGRVRANHTWTSTTFATPFSAPPVVISSVQTFEGDQPIITRHRMVSETGFEIRLQEEEAADGNHKVEEIAYIAVGACH